MLLTNTITALTVSWRKPIAFCFFFFLLFFLPLRLSIGCARSQNLLRKEALWSWTNFIRGSLKACSGGWRIFARTQVAFHAFGLRRCCWRSGVSAVFVQYVHLCVLCLTFVSFFVVCCRALVKGNMQVSACAGSKREMLLERMEREVITGSLLMLCVWCLCRSEGVASCSCRDDHLKLSGTVKKINTQVFYIT